jgi:hypothetical protein
VDYRVSETVRNQTIGLDAVSLILVAPASLLAGVLALRRHAAGPALALGIGAYTAYMLLQYVVGPDYLDYPGNNELLFPLCLILFVLGWGIVIVVWSAIDVDRLPRSARHDRLVGGVVLPVLAFLAFFRYLPALVDAMGDATEGGYIAGPTFFWAIALMDIGIFLPATAATCFGLLRGRPWAQKAMYAVVGWFGLVGSAVAGMAVAMYLKDDPNSSGITTVFMTGLGLAFMTLALWVYRPLFSNSVDRAAVP